STYLALIFGTLLSSQGTDASFVLTLSGFPPGFPSVFQTLSVFFRPSDHRPAGMQNMIRRWDLTSWMLPGQGTWSRRSASSRSTTVHAVSEAVQIVWAGGLDHQPVSSVRSPYFI
ncbi:hypothetical protein, partial [Streptomyces sp. NPDC006335]|uniref:hypothetical protein n=1 Tax=Streptomyces sp. NPDC006335 TaxID=3156895 RepID=UPI0033BB7EB0